MVTSLCSLIFAVIKFVYRRVAFLGAFAKLRKATINFMSACPPAWNTRLPLDGFA